MQFSIETITPKKAKEFLTTNVSNQRNVSAAHVNNLAQMMMTNEFDPLNGQTIKFNGKKGEERLIDGQHRLLALIKANRTMKMGVLRKCSSKAFETIDNAQKNRSIANYYEIDGSKHSKVSAQVARWLYLYETRNRRITTRLDKVPGHINKWASKNHPEIPKRIAEIEKHMNAFMRAGLGTKAHLAFVYYLAAQKDRIQAYKFAEYIGSNIGTPPKPLANAKQTLMVLAKKNAEKKLPGNYRVLSVLTVLMLGWNAMRGGRVKSVTGFNKAALNAIKQSNGDGAMHPAGITGSIPECL